MAIRVARPTVTLASSGPAVGTDVQPSTAIQKDQTGRSSAGGGHTSNAAGAPGVEGKPGSESGPPMRGC